MGTGYVRNDTANNIADGNVIDAADLDGEFDALQAAFNASTGHSHDGTVGEGPLITSAGLAAGAITSAAIANDSVALGTKTTGNYVAAGAVSGTGLSGSASAEGATFTVTSNATDANTASTIVARDASGNFSAGTITANLTGNVTGNADTATNAADSALLDGIDSTSFLRSDAADTKTSGDLSFSDNVKAVFGDGSDLQVYHSGSHSFIEDTGTGNLYLATNGASVRITKGPQNAENMAAFNPDGSAVLYYDNAPKIATTATGCDITGAITTDGLTTSADINFGDNDKAVFGAGNDLQIYHAGSNSFIDDAGSGSLYIRSDGVMQIQKYTGEVMQTLAADGAVTLYHDNAVKLTTTSSGVSVTGTVAATAFTGDGSSLTGVAAFPSGTLMLFQQTAAPTGWTKQTTHNDKALRVVNGTAGSGGSSAFTTAFGTPSVSGTVGLSGTPDAGNLAVSVSGNIADTTLSTNQIPSHSHSWNKSNDTSPNGGNAIRMVDSTPGNVSIQFDNDGTQTVNTNSTGGGGAHNHGHNLSGNMTGAPGVGNLAGSLSSATAAINVQYVDLIIAAKD